MKSLKNNAQAGFTLIELIVVIVILGILAATALPKFSNMSGDARHAALKGGRGAVAAAAQMAHAKYVLNSVSPQDIDGVSVTFSNGYPTIASIKALAGLEGYTVGAGSGTPPAADITLDNAPATCKFTYTEASASAPAAVGAAPALSACQ